MLASPITNMIRKLLNRLEDPNNPLMGPNEKALKLWGVLTPKSKLGKFSVYLINFLGILFVIFEYIDLWLMRSDIKLVFNNLRISVMSPYEILKLTLFYILQERWTDVMNYVTRSDIKMRLSKDPENIEIISNNTRYCRRLRQIYWFLTFITGVSVTITPLIVYLFSKTYRDNLKNGTANYIEILRCWMPFDKTKLLGYLFASLFQVFIACYFGGASCFYDTNAVIIMMFFKTELMVLENDSSKIFDSHQSPIDDDTFKRNIKECHRRHMELVKYTGLFTSCLSAIMFMYVILCSMMICAAAYDLTIVTDKLNYVVSGIYFTFGITQLFIFCWHSNEVMEASQKLMMGPYRSAWWGQSKEHLRDMFILINQFDKTIVFNAGPFTDLTVASFVSILKGGYSYFTLIK